MLKSFKLIITTLLTLFLSIVLYAQEQTEFKDVVLDGKPAKLNISTGEVTIVEVDKKDEDKVEPTKSAIEKDIVAVKSPSEAEVEFESDFHIVKEGENLFQISIKYETTLAALQKANKLETTLIQTGQKLRIRNFDTDSEELDKLIWTVRKGDTLYRIALNNDLTVEELKRLNGLTSNTIKIGQELRLK